MTPQNFHKGELKLQDQAGARAQIDALTKHLMHDFMPDEHRDFFEGLEYILLGTVDRNDLPHASLLTGAVGFVASPDPKTLVVQTRSRVDRAAFESLALGRPVGVLGLDLSNRRRNRMHGKISDLDDSSIAITVVQSYGNCPKYISLREVAERDHAPHIAEIVHRQALHSDDAAMIRAADTFFIASYLRDGSGAPYEGVDVNHRGGQPGFVSVDRPDQITIPDYRGNNLFNTFGNLLLNPETGLLFVDFTTGDQMHLHGRAVLIEDETAIAEFPGALRLLRVQITSVTRQTRATGMTWDFAEASPSNPSLSTVVE